MNRASLTFAIAAFVSMTLALWVYQATKKSVSTQGESSPVKVKDIRRDLVPPGLRGVVEIPRGKKDKIGNSIRKGQDPKTGWPLEVWEIRSQMPLVFIPAGSFEMGSTDGDDDEKPPHTVALSKSFYMGKYEVTKSQFERIMQNLFGTDSTPLIGVTWPEAENFIAKLNEKISLGGRLRFAIPTEAQWEYSCRAGSKTRFCFGNDKALLNEYAWSEVNSRRSSYPVGRKKPNAWGLYDMHGNLWEFCRDWYDQDYYSCSPERDPTGPGDGHFRTLRGGSWYNLPNELRSSSRGADLPGAQVIGFGFRVLLEFSQ